MYTVFVQIHNFDDFVGAGMHMSSSSGMSCFNTAIVYIVYEEVLGGLHQC